MSHALKYNKDYKIFRKKHIEENLWGLGLGKEFLDWTPKHDPQRENLINWTLSKFRTFSLQMNTTMDIIVYLSD